MANNNVKQGVQTPVEETLSKNEAFFLKYKKVILGAVAALVVIVAGCILYNQYVAEPKEAKASTILAKGQQYFAAEQYDIALQGDSAGFNGLLKVATEYSGTEAGNLANLYAGLCYAQLGKWQETVNFIERYSGNGDQMIAPAAEGALGNAYAHLEKLDEAVKHLKKAADMADNNSLSPTFLIQAGEILESQGKKAEALKLYQTIKDKYFNSMQYQTIDEYIERVKE